MSALVVDLGNTRWKLAVARDGRLGPVTGGDHGDDGKPADGLPKQAAGVTRLLVASVADAGIADPVIAGLEDALGLTARRISNSDRVPGVVAGYRKPEQLGVDRLLAMVAARAVSRAPLCVIDAGTALTIDFVDAAGQHLGGFILPGSALFRDCLLANTAIPRDPAVHAGDVLGRDTPTAVAQGARQAVAGIVERFLTGSQALFGELQPDLVIGGGDAELFAPLMPVRCIKLEHLVLRGLAVIDGHGEG
ncbi:MAG: type III pantothenate kinase [Gammaproteobacteria bacterium]|nr:type III pantothenate kinase [Gammaproteobacteria bacterium]